MKMRFITVTALAALLATPVCAQQTPPGANGSELNNRGTLGDAPDYGRRMDRSQSSDQQYGQPYGQQQASSPPAHRMHGPYDQRPFGPNHPDANGLNDQPKNSGDVNGG